MALLVEHRGGLLLADTQSGCGSAWSPDCAEFLRLAAANPGPGRRMDTPLISVVWTIS